MTPSTDALRAPACGDPTGSAVDLVVIGGSAGGIELLPELLAALPADFPLPVIVLVHLLPDAPSRLAEVLAARCALTVEPARDGAALVPGHVYVGIPGRHLKVDARRRLALSDDAPVRFSRPSIDVLFASAAESFGARVAALLLSGGGQDGADGLHAVARAGGVTLVQSPLSAAIPHLPQAALQRFQPTRVLDADQLAPFLLELSEHRPT